MKQFERVMLSPFAPLRTVLSAAKELRVNSAKHPGIWGKQNAEILCGVYREPKYGDSSLRSE